MAGDLLRPLFPVAGSGKHLVQLWTQVREPRMFRTVGVWGPWHGPRPRADLSLAGLPRVACSRTGRSTWTPLVESKGGVSAARTIDPELLKLFSACPQNSLLRVRLPEMAAVEKLPQVPVSRTSGVLP